jgi:hypothetical protein
MKTETKAGRKIYPNQYGMFRVEEKVLQRLDIITGEYETIRNIPTVIVEEK